MTADDLKNLETVLGISVPANYREWALSLPPIGQETKSWHWVFNDAGAIIEANEQLRAHGCQEQNWPNELFCIGEADSNHFFICLRETQDVYYTNHDDGPYFRTGSWRDCSYKKAAEFYEEA